MSTPLPEIRSVLERAATNRHLLDEFLEHAPPDRLHNTLDGELWSGHIHLAHVATADVLMSTLLADLRKGAFRLDAFLLGRRNEAIAAAAELPLAELRGLMGESRLELERLLAQFDDARLAHPVVVEQPGAWPPERQLSLRAYLAAWAEHDLDHLEAMRRVVTAPVSPAAMAAAARIRRDSR
jgi:hypothetical protein